MNDRARRPLLTGAKTEILQCELRVDAADPPLRIFFGSSGLPTTRQEYARRIEVWERWNGVSLEAQGDLAANPH